MLFSSSVKICKVSSITCNIKQTRFIAKMASDQEWCAVKSHILGLPLEEKRKCCRPDFVTLDKVKTWSQYCDSNKGIADKKPTDDDLNEFRKITLNTEKNKELSQKVSLFEGDITKLEIDAIVNAANCRLRAGGGVDGAIHKSAGPLLQEECWSVGGCPTGEARITGAYQLPAKYVIHTVGPQNGSAPDLKSCYEKSFALQVENKLKSIAFPCISTGIYGFPNRLAAHIALQSARKHLENNNLDRIIFCTFMPVDVDIYETLMQLYFPTN